MDINEEWEPIGTYFNDNTIITAESNIPFSGSFDGKGHEINGLKITSSEKGKGLFGLTNNAIIENLGIGSNCNITNVGNCSGSIVGYSYNSTTIRNCYNKSNVSGIGQQIGGIAGQNCPNSIIINSYNLGSVQTQSSSVGGITGNNAGTIQNCYNSGTISSALDSAGGICGLLSGIIENCYNTNVITATSNYSGGIAGMIYSTDEAKIANSYSIGPVISFNPSHGIAGGITQGTVENSYYLENSINGSNTSYFVGIFMKSSSELVELAPTLGSAFKPDLDNINNGYPILYWQ